MNEILHFSHANGFPAPCYRVLLNRLAEFCDVRSIDRLAHNPVYPVTDNWQQLKTELIHYFERNYRGPVIAVGHSLGSLLSLMVAAERPDLVRALIMLDAPAITPVQARGLQLMKWLRMADRITPAGRTEGRRRQWSSAEEARHYFSAKSLMKHFDPRCLQDYVDYGTEQNGQGVTLRFDPDIEMQIYRTIPHDLILRTPLTVPAAVIGGEDSKAFRRVNGAWMHSRLGMKVRWLPGTHMFPLEHPDQTADTIHQLLGQML